MTTIGIIAEYNPFHNGHIYHLEKIKEIFPDSKIVLVMSGNFTQRGLPSIINKWDKASIALKFGVDLVIELPYPFATQSADIFARGAIEILNEVNCDYLVFGSESNDIETLKMLADIQINNKNFDKLTKEYLDKGVNYPTAMNLALKKITKKEVNVPNDLLGLSYIKEIIKQNSKIIPVTIKRTNNYHDEEIINNIASATSIRNSLRNNKDISGAVPRETLELLTSPVFLDNYFSYFKYQVYTNKDLSKILDVDEGIENKVLKIIDDVTNFDEFINKIKTKRYTYNKIVRMINHILCSYTKEENENYKHVKYLRILGFTKNGKDILNKIKKTTKLKIITKYYSDIPELSLEKRITSIYSIPLRNNDLVKNEYQNKIIITK